MVVKMYNITFDPRSKNFRSRFKAHLLRCQAFYRAGGTLHNSVDYHFSRDDRYGFGEPNLDADFNIKHGVMYYMQEKRK